jgi:hypothetical protein
MWQFQTKRDVKWTSTKIAVFDQKLAFQKDLQKLTSQILHFLSFLLLSEIIDSGVNFSQVLHFNAQQNLVLFCPLWNSIS